MCCAKKEFSLHLAIAWFLQRCLDPCVAPGRMWENVVWISDHLWFFMLPAYFVQDFGIWKSERIQICWEVQVKFCGCRKKDKLIRLFNGIFYDFWTNRIDLASVPKTSDSCFSLWLFLYSGIWEARFGIWTRFNFWWVKVSFVQIKFWALLCGVALPFSSKTIRAGKSPKTFPFPFLKSMLFPNNHALKKSLN